MNIAHPMSKELQRREFRRIVNAARRQVREFHLDGRQNALLSTRTGVVRFQPTRIPREVYEVLRGAFARVVGPYAENRRSD